jgi:SAM-dependent methyltransferase
MSTALRFALKAAAAGGAIFILVGQCRKPSWWPGRFFLRSMNLTHSGLTLWGLSHVTIGPKDTVLDVGCGGGRTLDTLATRALLGHVSGVDYSATSVDVAKRVNAAAIEAGRMDVRQGSVSALPFADATFDVVTAVETHYYWPDLENDLREVRRALKPGGCVALIAEAYRGRRGDFIYRPAMWLLRATYLTPEEHQRTLEGAGFVDVEVYTERAKGWLCVVGRNPITLKQPSPVS